MSDMEHFGINTQKNYSNSFLGALFFNGQMMQCEDGVKFHGESPIMSILFIIMSIMVLVMSFIK